MVKSFFGQSIQNNNCFKKTAFTLAEVLITLGIIGVVAAMTIPTLISSYQKKAIENQIKQTYSLLSQGIRLAVAEEGVSVLTANDWQTNKESLAQFFQSYFKVAQSCDGSYEKCFSSSFRFLDGSSYSFSGYSCDLSYILINGTSVCVDLSDPTDASFVIPAGTAQNPSPFAIRPVITFEIDVNGPKPPNIFGYDMHGTLAVDEYGNLYVHEYKKDGAMTATGWGAIGQIMKDGWKIKYDLP